MSEFCESVYGVVKLIPSGKVATYGQIAKMLGNPRCSRAVGRALHFNPTPVIIPCHRVVSREGQLSPGFAFGGALAQKALLEGEGVEVGDDNLVDLDKYLWDNLSHN